MEENDENNITLIKNIQLNDKNEYTLDSIEPGKSIYINILARNIKTNELIIFKPLRGMLKPTKFSKHLSLIVALVFICLIVYISLHYYNEDNLTGYKLTNNNEIGRDDIKYTNLSMGP